MNPANIFILLFPILCAAVFSQDKPKTNLEIFEATITQGLERYLYSPDLNRNYQFIFAIDPGKNTDAINTLNSKTEFLTRLVKKTAADNNLGFSFIKDTNNIRSDSTYNLVILRIMNLETQYPAFKKNNFLGDKTMLRNIKVKIAVDISSSNGKFLLSDFIQANYEDAVKLDGYESLESSQYDFTKAEPPQIGAFESVVFPLLLITTTAAATLLFFIIRTR